MILTDIRDYVRERRRVPLIDLRARFDVDADALRGMLDLLERRNRIRRSDPACPGKDCSACGGSCFEMVEWVDEA